MQLKPLSRYKTFPLSPKASSRPFPPSPSQLAPPPTLRLLIPGDHSSNFFHHGLILPGVPGFLWTRITLQVLWLLSCSPIACKTHPFCCFNQEPFPWNPVMFFGYGLRRTLASVIHDLTFPYQATLVISSRINFV